MGHWCNIHQLDLVLSILLALYWYHINSKDALHALDFRNNYWSVRGVVVLNIFDECCVGGEPDGALNLVGHLGIIAHAYSVYAIFVCHLFY